MSNRLPPAHSRPKRETVTAEKSQGNPIDEYVALIMTVSTLNVEIHPHLLVNEEQRALCYVHTCVTLHRHATRCHSGTFLTQGVCVFFLPRCNSISHRMIKQLGGEKRICITLLEKKILEITAAVRLWYYTLSIRGLLRKEGQSALTTLIATFVFKTNTCFSIPMTERT